MKPAQIFEKHPTADAYKVGASFTPYAVMAVDKRLTDAEMAAEWQYATGEASIVFFANHEFPDDDLNEKEDTLLRFARSPHFDEG